MPYVLFLIFQIILASTAPAADIVAAGTVRIVAAKEGSGYTASSVMVVAATATGQSN